MNPNLFNAASSGKLEEVGRLIGFGANVNYAEPTMGCSPLWAASEKGHKDVAEVLLRNGAKVDQATNDYGATPLMDSITGGT